LSSPSAFGHERQSMTWSPSGSAFATILCLPIPSKSEFYKIQRAYLIPVINDYWTMHQFAALHHSTHVTVATVADILEDPVYRLEHN